MKSVQIGMRPAGHIKIQKGKAGEGINWESDFPNLVLDVGWDNLKSVLAAENSPTDPLHLFLGSGTTEPAATDSGLESISGTLAGKAFSTRKYPATVTAQSPRVRLRFDYTEGEAEGVWTELGLAFDSQYSSPYNRSLIRDGNGDPTSLTILSDEFLTVYVELVMYFTSISGSGSIDYNGQSVGYTTAVGASAVNFHGKVGEPLQDQSGDLYSFWGRGFGGFSMEYQGTQSSGTEKTNLNFDSYYLGMSNVPGTLRWERASDVYSPGVERTFESMVFGTVLGTSVMGIVEVTLDTPIVIPSDHQATLGVHSVEFFRDTVPAS